MNDLKKILVGALSLSAGLLRGKKSQENKPSTAPKEDKPSITPPKPAPATAKNKKKRSGYFMELDEADEVKPVEAKSSASNGAKTPEPATAAKPATEPAKTPEPATAAKPAKVELVQTAKGVKAEPVKPGSSQAASVNGQAPTETTFAPKYLAPSSTSNRRRPGPSMNSFLDMADQVKNGREKS